MNDKERILRFKIARLCIDQLEWRNDYEFGGLGMDQKRPFGNSGCRAIAEDIAECVGIDMPEDSDQEERILSMYRETADFMREHCLLVMKRPVTKSET